MIETDLKRRLHEAVIRLMLRGPVTTRLLYADDHIWCVKEALGAAVAERWLRELAEPAQEPPEADTRWWLIGVKAATVPRGKE